MSFTGFHTQDGFISGTLVFFYFISLKCFFVVQYRTNCCQSQEDGKSICEFLTQRLLILTTTSIIVQCLVILRTESIAIKNLYLKRLTFFLTVYYLPWSSFLVISENDFFCDIFPTNVPIRKSKEDKNKIDLGPQGNFLCNGLGCNCRYLCPVSKIQPIGTYYYL